MSRIMLIFGAALIALMAGALFYAARIPVTTEAPPPPQPRQLEVVTHPQFALPDLEGTERAFAEWDLDTPRAVLNRLGPSGRRKVAP